MKSSLNLGKVHDIGIFIHYSWLFIFLIVAWSLATDMFPYYYPELTTKTYWIIGIISALLLFVSVLLHELSHSIAAKYSGIKVSSITLFFFGGVATIDEEGISPMKEMMIALVGPLFSIVFGMIFYLIMLLMKTNVLFPSETALVSIISAIAFYLSRINLILAFFNMIPAYPLDGGRVLRAFLWGWTNDIKKATMIASKGGKWFGILLIVIGVLNVLFFNFGGLWFIFLGFFLYMIAGAGYQQVIIKQELEIPIKDFITKKFEKVSLNESIAEIMKKAINSKTPQDTSTPENALALQNAFIVIDKNKVKGIIKIKKLNELSDEKKKSLKAKDVVEVVPLLNQSANAYNAFNIMMRTHNSILPVVNNKQEIIGIVEGNKIINYLNVKLGKSSE
ncbi:M50 family metallopeptidase [Candidatus Woesearchaeota archaeon]|nr:M50 family metallopeptidase [Candidatus Woesearchaeota archaeon]